MGDKTRGLREKVQVALDACICKDHVLLGAPLRDIIASSALAAAVANPNGRAELLQWLSAHGERADEQMRAGLLRGADASHLVPALMHALLDRAKETRNAAEATLRLVVVSGAAPRSAMSRAVRDFAPAVQRSLEEPIARVDRVAQTAASATGKKASEKDGELGMATAAGDQDASLEQPEPAAPSDAAKAPASHDVGAIEPPAPPGDAPTPDSSARPPPAEADENEPADAGRLLILLQPTAARTKAKGVTTKAQRESAFARLSWPTPPAEPMKPEHDALREAWTPLLSADALVALFPDNVGSMECAEAGIAILHRALATQPGDVLVHQLDLVLRWLVIRLCHKRKPNTLGRLLELLHAIVAGVRAHNHSLADFEARILLPQLLERAGQPPKDKRFGDKVREVLVAVRAVFPVSKYVGFVLGTLGSTKNTRSRVACLNELEQVLPLIHPDRWRQAGLCPAAKATSAGGGGRDAREGGLARVARMVETSESEVREAALRVCAAAFRVLGCEQARLFVVMGGTPSGGLPFSDRITDAITERIKTIVAAPAQHAAPDAMPTTTVTPLVEASDAAHKPAAPAGALRGVPPSPELRLALQDDGDAPSAHEVDGGVAAGAPDPDTDRVFSFDPGLVEARESPRKADADWWAETYLALDAMLALPLPPDPMPSEHVTKLRAGKEALKRVHDRLAPPSEEPAAVRDDERAVWQRELGNVLRKLLLVLDKSLVCGKGEKGGIETNLNSLALSTLLALCRSPVLDAAFDVEMCNLILARTTDLLLDERLQRGPLVEQTKVDAHDGHTKPLADHLVRSLNGVVTSLLAHAPRAVVIVSIVQLLARSEELAEPQHEGASRASGLLPRGVISRASAGQPKSRIELYAKTLARVIKAETIGANTRKFALELEPVVSAIDETLPKLRQREGESASPDAESPAMIRARAVAAANGAIRKLLTALLAHRGLAEVSAAAKSLGPPAGPPTELCLLLEKLDSASTRTLDTDASAAGRSGGASSGAIRSELGRRIAALVAVGAQAGRSTSHGEHADSEAAMRALHRFVRENDCESALEDQLDLGRVSAQFRAHVYSRLQELDKSGPSSADENGQRPSAPSVSSERSTVAQAAASVDGASQRSSRLQAIRKQLRDGGTLDLAFGAPAVLGDANRNNPVTEAGLAATSSRVSELKDRIAKLQSGVLPP